MLNLLPWREQEFLETKRLFLTWGSIFVALFFVVMIGWRQLLVHNLTRLRHANLQLHQSIEQMNKKAQAFRSKLKQVEQVERVQKLLNTQKELRVLLETIADDMPLDCCFTTLIFNQDQIIFHGFILSSNFENLRKMVSNIQKKQRVIISLSESPNSGAQKIGFKMSIKLLLGIS